MPPAGAPWKRGRFEAAGSAPSPPVHVDPPVFQWGAFCYEVEVMCGRCPGYSRPYGEGGHWITDGYVRGMRVEIVDAVMAKWGDYVSARTVRGEWINVWSLRNRDGHPVGVQYCKIVPHRRPWLVEGGPTWQPWPVEGGPTWPWPVE